MFFSNDSVCSVHIDFSNLQHTARALHFVVDYEKLLAFLKEKYNPKVISIYIPLPPGLSPNKTIASLCISLGYRVVIRETKMIYTNQGPRFIKGNMDIELCTDALQMHVWARTYVLVTGDSDFTYMCGVLRGNIGEISSKIIAISSKRVCFMSQELFDVVHEFVELADISTEIQE